MKKQSYMPENVTYIPPTQTNIGQKKRYAAYVRVSSGSEEQLHSYANQISYYIRMFRDNEEDMELVDIYADEAITGTTEKRDDFQRMINDCRKGKIDRIITKSITRFSRDNATTLKYVRELMQMGVSILFESENIDTDTMKTEFGLNLHSLVSQQTSKTISKNTRKGFEMRALRGEYNQSKKPYGYNLIDKELVPNEDEAIIVRRIFDEFLDGLSMTDIARRLTAENIKSPTGKDKWHFSAVRTILGNERCIGDMELQKKYSTDTTPIQKKINYNVKDKYYIEETHEPIVEKHIFELAQSLIEKKNEKYHSKCASLENHFTKMIRCTCGKTLRRKIVNHKVYWSCNARDRGDSDCEVTQIPEHEIEKSFIRMLNKLIQTKYTVFQPMLESLITLRKLKNSMNDEISTVSKDIREIYRQSSLLSSLRAKGIMEPAFFISQQSELDEKLIKLKKKKQLLLEDEENDDLIIQTKTVINILESYENQILEWNEIDFKQLVKGITAESREKLTFILINDLKIPEKVERSY